MKDNKQKLKLTAECANQPLLVAARNNHWKIAKLLIDKGVIIDRNNNHFKMLKLLIYRANFESILSA